MFNSLTDLFYNNNSYSIQLRRRQRQRNFKIYGATFLISFLYYYALEICNRNWACNGVTFTFVNVFIIYAFILLISLVVVRRWIAAIIGGGVTILVSVINFYTVLYRNQPVSTLDIHNAGTAMGVLSSYKLGFHVTLLVAVLLFVVGVVLSVLLLRRLEREKEQSFREYFIRFITTVILTFIFIYVVFLGKYSLKPKLTLVWSWEETYHKYGFLSITEELFAKSFNKVRMPEYYNEEELKKYAAKKENGGAKRKPDVILIMNETFFDLANVTDLKTDKEVMPFIKSLDNKISGYSIVPGSGGGTNRSEYELLTSNSLSLMPGITPFPFLDLNGASSIVSFLKSKGYTTAASHCSGSLNYVRGNAYPKLGFDKSFFIEDFGEIERFENRTYANDEFVYRHMIEQYNKMGDGPRFFFNLTIQNHGDWCMNEDYMDTIHSKTDFGEYTDDVNEYLTLINLSDSAFEYLVKYFETVERDVIICMVGDHSPVFTTEISTVDIEKSFDVLKLYSTPFVMWANFDIEDKDIGYTSMPFIVPLMLDAAGMEKSPFYNFILDMHKKYPIVTGNNCYGDTNHKMKNYKHLDEAPEIKTYFNMVYNRASEKVKPEDKLFP